MTTKTKVLTFDETTWHKPVVSTLAKRFELDFSILKAKVLPRRVGVLVLELSGSDQEMDKAVQYLEQQGVGIESIEQEILYDEDLCTQCGACVGFCPTDALTLKDADSDEVAFVAERCIGCELCLTACPARALKPSEQMATFESYGRTH
jgi:L-aspartate semialdehyde sulfurtransferase ferredoxin